MGTPAEPLSDAVRASHRFSVRSRRDRLLAAVAEVVGSEGYQGTSVSKIVARASVSRNTFYEHFANKEDCFLAAYDEALERAVAHVRAASHPADSWDERLEAGLAAFLRFAASEPELACLCFVEVLAAGPRALARRDEAMRVFARFLARSRDRDAVEVPPLLTEVVAGGIYEIVYARILERRTESLPELLPDVMYVWSAAFVGPARAASARAASARRMGLDVEPILRVATTNTGEART